MYRIGDISRSIAQHVTRRERLDIVNDSPPIQESFRTVRMHFRDHRSSLFSLLTPVAEDEIGNVYISNEAYDKLLEYTENNAEEINESPPGVIAAFNEVMGNIRAGMPSLGNVCEYLRNTGALSQGGRVAGVLEELAQARVSVMLDPSEEETYSELLFLLADKFPYFDVKGQGPLPIPPEMRGETKEVELLTIYVTRKQEIENQIR